MGRKAKSWIVSATFLSLVVGMSLVSWYLQPSAVAFARESPAERLGVAPDALELVGQENFSPLTPALVTTMTVRFRVKGAERSKKQVVELFRIAYFLPWWVSAYRESVE
jgi:hypothetical protein